MIGIILVKDINTNYHIINVNESVITSIELSDSKQINYICLGILYVFKKLFLKKHCFIA